MRYKDVVVRGARINSTGPRRKAEAPPKKSEPVVPSAFVVQYLVLDHGMKMADAMRIADVADEVCSGGGSLSQLRKVLDSYLDDVQVGRALWKIQGLYEAHA